MCRAERRNLEKVITLFVESKWLTIQCDGHTIYNGKVELDASDVEWVLKQLGYRVDKVTPGK